MNVKIPKIEIKFSKGDKTVGISKYRIKSDEIFQTEYRMYLFPFEFQITNTSDSFKIGIKFFSVVFRFEIGYE